MSYQSPPTTGLLFCTEELPVFDANEQAALTIWLLALIGVHGQLQRGFGASDNSHFRALESMAKPYVPISVIQSSHARFFKVFGFRMRWSEMV
jgi:hypothetical protein